MTIGICAVFRIRDIKDEAQSAKPADENSRSAQSVTLT